jgi:hypothetical protein
MIIERSQVVNLLSGDGPSGGRGDGPGDRLLAQRAERELPPFFDTTQYRDVLESLGLDVHALTAVNDRLSRDDPPPDAGHHPS